MTLHTYNENGRWTRRALVVSSTKPIAFSLVPKVCSTSIVKSVMEMDGIAVGDNVPEIHRLKWQKMTRPEVPEGHYVCAFVRNPFERIASVWFDKVWRSQRKPSQLRRVLGRLNFEEFIGALETEGIAMDGHTASQCDFVFRQDGSRLVDFLGRYEAMERDWGVLEYAYGLPKLKILNRGGGSPLDWYRGRSDLVNRIQALYARDLDRFGYSFDG